MSENLPLVSVVTPVYNGEKYLVECIESVLAQDYWNWEYLLVNNCSTDSTRDIAVCYSKKHARIRVHSFEEFLPVIENHNRALRLISTDSKYCKVVSADDRLMPECIARLVEIAEENPSVGVVGSYQLFGGGAKWGIGFGGLPYPAAVVAGRDICRWHLLGKPYVFGNPTSVLYRSDLIRKTENFYPNSREQADVSVCYKILQSADFGFVHQILSYCRYHGSSLSTEAARIGTSVASLLVDHFEYGHVYLTKREYEKRLREVLHEYYKYLAKGILHFRDRKFWTFHTGILAELALPLVSTRLISAMFAVLLDLLLDPRQTVEIMRRMNANKRSLRRAARAATVDMTTGTR